MLAPWAIPEKAIIATIEAIIVFLLSVTISDLLKLGPMGRKHAAAPVPLPLSFALALISVAQRPRRGSLVALLSANVRVDPGYEGDDLFWTGDIAAAVSDFATAPEYDDSIRHPRTHRICYG